MTEVLHGGTANRARVAAELKRIREGLGIPGEEVAAVLGWSQPKVSRIENARIAVSTRDLATLLRLPIRYSSSRRLGSGTAVSYGGRCSRCGNASRFRQSRTPTLASGCAA
ncbi:helix-turn-helix domain-containing protein [Micromonospora aurantiaca]|nr:helix-turn-helix domain-containing protein [Micromonospora aurantiaca]